MGKRGQLCVHSCFSLQEHRGKIHGDGSRRRSHRSLPSSWSSTREPEASSRRFNDEFVERNEKALVVEPKRGLKRRSRSNTRPEKPIL